MKYRYIIMSICGCISLACSHLSEDSIQDRIASDDGNVKTKIPRPVVFEQINPYLLQNVQRVYSKYGIDTTLAPTDLYVRFMPRDSLELKSLQEDYDLELFDYPMNVVLEEGDTYIEENLPDTVLTWVYTTVSPDFQFPDDIPHTVLQQCYIPRENQHILLPRINDLEPRALDLEEEAYLEAGYVFPTTRSLLNGSKPQGTFTVFDNYAHTYEPLKGIKVRCHKFVKWDYAYTDEDGHYSMSKRFFDNPNYTLLFENSKGFTIWGNLGPLAKASYNLGRHSKSGFSHQIDTCINVLEWSAINNAAYDYYEMCEETGIAYPPDSLKIWATTMFVSSSAPMLHHIVLDIGGDNNFNSIFLSPLVSNLGNNLHANFKILFPDITIETLESDATEYQINNFYANAYEVVFHELSHASHYRVVGDNFWNRYINYIIEHKDCNSVYGSISDYDSQLCGVGEMWGHFMQYRIRHIKYPERTDDDPDLWFAPEILSYCYDTLGLGVRELFNCFTAETDSLKNLALNLCEAAPLHRSDIITRFNNKFVLSIPLPSILQLSDCIIQHDTLITTQTPISLNNITVSNGASLSLIGSELTINAPFWVQAGSSFSFTRNSN